MQRNQEKVLVAEVQRQEMGEALSMSMAADGLLWEKTLALEVVYAPLKSVGR